jgi:hypothetical protein
MKQYHLIIQPPALDLDAAYQWIQRPLPAGLRASSTP